MREMFYMYLQFTNKNMRNNYYAGIPWLHFGVIFRNTFCNKYMDLNVIVRVCAVPIAVKTLLLDYTILLSGVQSESTLSIW